MIASVDRLFAISHKPWRLIIGLMSGTSVDGLDVALCKCTGSGPQTSIEILQFETVAYSDEFRREIQSVFARRTVDLQAVCLLNAWVADQHADTVIDCLRRWNLAPGSIDLVASHGQTIYHAPKYLHKLPKFSNATLQIGDGDHLAVKTGIITISDFRQKHIASGGEGAPLAVYGDFYIFSRQGENRIMLNIGGIANFTFLPGDLDAARVFCTDTGTGNTLMDAFIQENMAGLYYDQHASIASRGSIHEPLLKALKSNAFFDIDFPKTTGPELFNLNYLEQAKSAAGVLSISPEDVMATLNRFSADTIAEAVSSCCAGLEPAVVYTSGGGMHNPLLMKNIREQLPGFIFKTTESLGINPDAKEALLFAVLANECVAGSTGKIGDARQVLPFASMGKISFPD